jgi:hypothetical protein
MLPDSVVIVGVLFIAVAVSSYFEWRKERN